MTSPLLHMDISERRNQLIGGGVFIKVIHSALNVLSSSEANTIFSRQNQQHSRIEHNIPATNPAQAIWCMLRQSKKDEKND